VFLYYFAHVAPRAGGRDMGNVGATHAAEIAYVFQRAAPNWTAAERKLSESISDYWVNFARTGDPNGSGLPAWPAYAADAPNLLKLDTEPTVMPIPDPQRMEVLDQYYAWRREELAR
jgi:para-nitrobenzyl esterase